MMSIDLSFSSLFWVRGVVCCYGQPVNMEESATYTIRPNFKNKFRPSLVNDMIYKVLSESLHDKKYEQKEAEALTKDMTEIIRKNLKELGLKRYKYVVQVVLGEHRGEGVKMGSRCFWDTDTDNYGQGFFMNDTLFAVGVVYGIYYY